MRKIYQFLKLLFHKLLLTWEVFTASWLIYLEEPLPEAELTYSRQAASIPSFGFFFLLICATILSTLGLLADSSAVIIGAMIIAPLMNPILSMAFAIVTADWKLYKRSLVTLFLGAFSAILVSSLISFVLPLSVIGEEVIRRTRPNLIDLGIAIAAGAAGSFSLTRKSIVSSIAGVAIAVALIPPLCVVGIGLGIGDQLAAGVGRVSITNITVADGAFLLFLANLAGITFTACLVFLSQSYGNFRKAFQTLVIWLLIMALLSGPLSNSLKEFIVANRLSLEIHRIRIDKPEIWQQVQVQYLDVQLKSTTIYLTILLNAPEELLKEENVEFCEKRLFNIALTMGVSAMDSDIRIIPVKIRKYKSMLKN